jgi:ribonuclease D
VVERYGSAILAAIERGEAVPESELPVPWRQPRPPVVPAQVRRRAEALRGWRATAATRLDLDPGVLLPGRLIDLIAAMPRVDRDALERIEGLRHWRVREFADELMAAVAPHAG